MAYHFNISLSVLNHLGRNLYRNFITIIGEAVSNAWDADATEVKIYLEEDNKKLTVWDNGTGMTEDDFQNKFLKIGYNKRSEGNKSPKGRPYIGRKGIGKLALLSCADKVTVLTKTNISSLTGGVIDNGKLDSAITADNELYSLDNPDEKLKSAYNDISNGTVIILENLNSRFLETDALRRLVALYFRFSLVAKDFRIFINNKEVTFNDISDLLSSTQFLWTTENYSDDFTKNMKNVLRTSTIAFKDISVTGFIASTVKPKDLLVFGMGEKVGIDVFVTGRLREKNILKSIPTARIAESYLYGQLSIEVLEDDKDRFTSSREGIKPDDELYSIFLKEAHKIILGIIEEWDTFRLEFKQDGDPEKRTAKRKSEELSNIVIEEYVNSIGSKVEEETKSKVENWLNDMRDDASFNALSYIDCYFSENLLRQFAKEHSIKLQSNSLNELSTYKKKERKDSENLSFIIRRNPDKYSYLSLPNLAQDIENHSNIEFKYNTSALTTLANKYKPMRNACAHTALLTVGAKEHLTNTFNDIKAKIIDIITRKEVTNDTGSK